jgi:PAS domain-containing protein
MIDEIFWYRTILTIAALAIMARAWAWLYMNVIQKVQKNNQADIDFKELVISNQDSLKITVDHIQHTLTIQADISNSILKLGDYAFWYSDKKGDCVLASPMLCSILNCTESDILGGNWVNRIVPEDRSRVENEYMKSVHDRTKFDSKYTFDLGNGLFQFVRGIAYHNQSGSIGKISPIGERSKDYVSKVHGGKIYNISNIENAKFNDDETKNT